MRQEKTDAQWFEFFEKNGFTVDQVRELLFARDRQREKRKIIDDEERRRLEFLRWLIEKGLLNEGEA